jgi:membrane protease YdiL (CAAX protease family)
MAPEPSDPLLGVVVIVLAIASVGVWFALFDRLKRGPILAYEPRRPVPWNGAWTLFPIGFVVLAIASATMSPGDSDGADGASPRDMVERLAVGSALQTSLVVAFLAVVIISSNATRTDLGLPKDAAELSRDVRIGVIAWLAALAPVYGTQLTLLTLFGPSEGHPLLKMVEQQADAALFVLAFFAAVIAAPLCEELTFRLVLQGWLEKWDAWRGGSQIQDFDVVETPVHDEESAALEPMEAVFDEGLMPVDAPRETGFQRTHWLPIVISSLLFALAHFGYGPDPVPLFLLALVLGYVYQRTHRIVPSIVAHALFNAVSLFALWRVMSAGGP